MSRVWIIVLAACTLTGCDADPLGGEVRLPGYEYMEANYSIADLVNNYNGEALTVYDDIIVAGWVTANDESNNFYRTFVLQDLSGAVEVKAGMFDLHDVFTRGRRIAIKAKGLAVERYNGVIQLGRAPGASDSRTEYIATRFYPGSYFWPQEDSRTVEPLEMELAELTDDDCGMLVRIDGLRYAESEDDDYVTWADGKQNAIRRFEDNRGAEIAVLTSGYADFSAEPVPRGTVRLTGILMRDKAGLFMLKLRDIKDVEPW